MPEGLKGGRGGRFLSRAISSFRAWLSWRRLLLSRRSHSTSCSSRAILPARSETSSRRAVEDSGLVTLGGGTVMQEVNHESRSGGIPRPLKCPDDGLPLKSGLEPDLPGPAKCQHGHGQLGVGTVVDDVLRK